MKKQSAKKRRGDVPVKSIDRLSELPQPTLHHILSLLSQKDAVRTCVLSKSWRYLWHGRTSVEFSEECLKKEFWPFIDKTLKRYRDHNLSVGQFIVDMQSKRFDSESKVLLKKWITIGIMNMGVRALSLKFHWSDTFFAVPLVVFQAEFLVELNLKGCQLNQIKTTDNVMCKHLQKLCLHDVHVDNETFEKIMSSCPLIENLDIQSCKGLRTINGKNVMPLVVFQAEFLVELNLRGCKLDQIESTDNVLCKHLQKLCLNDVDVDDETFDKILSSCPLIENLDIQGCFGLRTIESNIHKIKHIDYLPFFGYEIIFNIQMASPCTLVSIRISKCRVQYSNTFFSHLRSLKLCTVELSEDIFDNFSSNFPSLIELTLDSCCCYGKKEFLLILKSCSIKSLTIKRNLEKIEALIDTPNILYFEYSGSEYGVLPSIKFEKTYNEWESQISVGYLLKPSEEDATKWFLDLHELLKGLIQSRKITLSLPKQRYQKLHIKDSSGFSKPVAVESLRFSGFTTTSSASDILNCFLRVCRPRYIHVNRTYAKKRATSIWEKVNRQLVELIFKLIPVETRRFYLWLQDLEEVSIEVWDMKAQEWHCIQVTRLPALPKKKEEQQIRFRLKWRDQQLAILPS